jgi:hypothetical protein
MKYTGLLVRRGCINTSGRLTRTRRDTSCCRLVDIAHVVEAALTDGVHRLPGEKWRHLKGWATDSRRYDVNDQSRIHGAYFDAFWDWSTRFSFHNGAAHRCVFHQLQF